MTKFLLAVMVETLGNEEFSKWPLHITILPWFSPPGSEVEMLTDLADIFQFKSGFEVTAEDKSFFGRIPIHLIHPINGRPQLVELHNEILDSLQAKGYKIQNINYVGDNYSPHITVKGDRSIQAGEVISIKSLTLVKSVSEQPKIRQKVQDISFL